MELLMIHLFRYSKIISIWDWHLSMEKHWNYWSLRLWQLYRVVVIVHIDHCCIVPTEKLIEKRCWPRSSLTSTLPVYNHRKSQTINQVYWERVKTQSQNTAAWCDYKLTSLTRPKIPKFSSSRIWRGRASDSFGSSRNTLKLGHIRLALMKIMLVVVVHQSKWNKEDNYEHHRLEDKIRLIIGLVLDAIVILVIVNRSI